MDSKGKQKAEEAIKKTEEKDTVPSVTTEASSFDGYDHEDEDDEEEDEDEEARSYDEQEEEWDESREEEIDHAAEDEDEDDDMDEDDELNRIRRTLGLQMQGLFGGIMSSDSGKFRTILASLKNNEDPTMQLIALQELAEILSVSSEENLAGYFSSDSFSKELVRIMKGPDDMLSGADMDDDMMLALAMSEGLSAGNPEVNVACLSLYIQFIGGHANCGYKCCIPWCYSCPLSKTQIYPIYRFG